MLCETFICTGCICTESTHKMCWGKSELIWETRPLWPTSPEVKGVGEGEASWPIYMFRQFLPLEGVGTALGVPHSDPHLPSSWSLPTVGQVMFPQLALHRCTGCLRAGLVPTMYFVYHAVPHSFYVSSPCPVLLLIPVVLPSWLCGRQGAGSSGLFSPCWEAETLLTSWPRAAMSWACSSAPGTSGRLPHSSHTSLDCPTSENPHAGFSPFPGALSILTSAFACNYWKPQAPASREIYS